MQFGSTPVPPPAGPSIAVAPHGHSRPPTGVRRRLKVGTGARAALYAGKGCLMKCAREAVRAGLRVVTALHEDAGTTSGLGAPKLTALVDRLGEEEFEVIVADVGVGRVVTITGGQTKAQATDAPRTDTSISPEGVRAEADRGCGPVTAASTAIRCAIYVRVASASQARPYPLADQWDACEAFAVKQGWETVKVYKDNADSGRKWSRLSFDAMMADAKRGAFDVVLVKDLDRLSRNASNLRSLLKRLNGLGVGVDTVCGGAATIIGTRVFRGVMPRSAAQRIGVPSRQNTLGERNLHRYRGGHNG